MACKKPSFAGVQGLRLRFPPIFARCIASSTKAWKMCSSAKLSALFIRAWASFRPRYHFDDHWSVRGRFDYTKEVTNAEQTTYRNEDVFGDIWTDVVYEARLDRWWRDQLRVVTDT